MRIRNLSSRGFQITHAGHPLYAPKIGGRLCDDNTFDVPPGFDEAAEGLIVPWAMTAHRGLVVAEVGTDDYVRCVVGPNDNEGGGLCWVRTHTAGWFIVSPDRWLALGRSTVFGAMGEAPELRLTLRDPPKNPVGALWGRSTDGEFRIAESIQFEHEISCVPPNTILLNVYDLSSVASIPNALFCNTLMKTVGAFHATVEVHGEEWGFYRQQRPDQCGICKSRQTRHHPVHIYRQSMDLGSTTLNVTEVRGLLVSEMQQQWPSKRYDIVFCNCIHFCDAFLGILGAKPVPAWVKGLHETGAAILTFPWSSSSSSTANPDRCEPSRPCRPCRPPTPATNRRRVQAVQQDEDSIYAFASARARSVTPPDEDSVSQEPLSNRGSAIINKTPRESVPTSSAMSSLSSSESSPSPRVSYLLQRADDGGSSEVVGGPNVLPRPLQAGEADMAAPNDTPVFGVSQTKDLVDFNMSRAASFESLEELKLENSNLEGLKIDRMHTSTTQNTDDASTPPTAGTTSRVATPRTPLTPLTPMVPRAPWGPNPKVPPWGGIC